MIYILEIPQQGRAHAWFAFDKQDLSSQDLLRQTLAKSGKYSMS